MAEKLDLEETQRINEIFNEAIREANETQRRVDIARITGASVQTFGSSTSVVGCGLMSNPVSFVPGAVAAGAGVVAAIAGSVVELGATAAAVVLQNQIGKQLKERLLAVGVDLEACRDLLQQMEDINNQVVKKCLLQKWEAIICLFQFAQSVWIRLNLLATDADIQKFLSRAKISLKKAESMGIYKTAAGKFLIDKLQLASKLPELFSFLQRTRDLPISSMAAIATSVFQAAGGSVSMLKTSINVSDLTLSAGSPAVAILSKVGIASSLFGVVIGGYSIHQYRRALEEDKPSDTAVLLHRYLEIIEQQILAKTMIL